MAYTQNEVIVPVINLNGSSPDRLVDGYRAVLDALHGSIEALQQAAPHGRDYQTEADSVFDEACEQHRMRMHTLNLMAHEIRGIALAVLEQKRGK